jgi:transcriptional antiterminator Rof (Rho-off)
METKMRELIETYDEYIQLLTDSEADMLGLAYAHGYRCPPELVKRGEKLRAKIAELKERAEDEIWSEKWDKN